MPIDLPDVSDDVDRLKAPDPKVWVALLVAVMAASIAWTLLTWPEGKPTGTPWFWMRLLGYPALVWAAIFGFRVHFYEDEKHRLVAIAEVDKADREEAIAFGAEPLAVLGNAYLCAMGRMVSPRALRPSKRRSQRARLVPGMRPFAIRALISMKGKRVSLVTDACSGRCWRRSTGHCMKCRAACRWRSICNCPTTWM